MKLFAWFELIVAMIILPVMLVAPLCKKSEPVSKDEDLGECDQCENFVSLESSCMDIAAKAKADGLLASNHRSSVAVTHPIQTDGDSRRDGTFTTQTEGKGR